MSIMMPSALGVTIRPAMTSAMVPGTSHDSDDMRSSGCEASRVRVTQRHASVEWSDSLLAHPDDVGAQAHRVRKIGPLY